MAALAQAWRMHGNQLLSPAGDPALDRAWGALQPHLAVAPEEKPAVAANGEPAPSPAEALVDAGAFLDSLDAASAATSATVAGGSFNGPPEAARPPVRAAEEPVPPEIMEALAQASKEAFEAAARQDVEEDEAESAAFRAEREKVA